MIDITFVPLWLERHLKSLGHPITVVGQPSELANILSHRDLKNYKAAVRYFQQSYLVEHGLVEHDLPYIDVIHGLQSSDIVGYLYGGTFVGSDSPDKPEFHINVIGDGVYVTVASNLGSKDVAPVHGKFVTDLLGAIVNYMPLNQVTRTKLFRNYVTVAASAKK